MASTYTTNLHLEKPDGDDDISVLAINGNSDILDAAIKALQDKFTTTIAYPTATSGSKWTNGTISLRKRAGIVMIKMDGAVFSEFTQRETFAMIPEGYRPVTECYFFSSDLSRKFLALPGGELKAEKQNAGTCWGTECYITST